MMMMILRMYCKDVDSCIQLRFCLFFYDSMFVSNNTISLCDKSTREREREKKSETDDFYWLNRKKEIYWLSVKRKRI